MASVVTCGKNHFSLGQKKEVKEKDLILNFAKIPDLYFTISFIFNPI